MKKKAVDCVEIQHQGADKVQEELAGMTREQQLEYWRKRTAELLELQRKTVRKAKAS